MNENEVPAPVLEALQTLESAHAPTELGPAYQTLLDWRRRRPVGVFASNAALPIGVIILLSVMMLSVSVVDVPVTDFWRGVNAGLTSAAILVAVQNMIWRRPRPPQSISARIESAIDRWRHAVPAMRELPR